jgi:AbrB family looped-hinge helix DNA binding protein
MPKISAKRQITLPKELCDRLGIHSGDDIDILEYGGRITILKKVKGASAGVLQVKKVNAHFTDDDSLRLELEKRRPSPKRKGKAA